MAKRVSVISLMMKNNLVFHSPFEFDEDRFSGKSVEKRFWVMWSDGRHLMGIQNSKSKFFTIKKRNIESISIVQLKSSMASHFDPAMMKLAYPYFARNTRFTIKPGNVLVRKLDFTGLKIYKKVRPG